MRILGIESSCDETALALVAREGDRIVVERSVLSSQARVHARYGGVVPEVAAREHAAHIFPLLEELGVARDGEGIDAVAVTVGPGLIPALRSGVELGKALAWAWGKPIVPVNHLEGHVYSVWAVGSEQLAVGSESVPRFPALCLIVSGGHTELVFMRDHGKYDLLGRTRDDAAGEAFDKVAKLLGLGYPGGPEISRLAEGGDAGAIEFPRPMIESGDFDFSFSGLKTAVRIETEKQKDRKTERQKNIATAFQQAVVDVLVAKTLRAVARTNPRSVILTGGVSANTLLRSTLERSLHDAHPNIYFFAPDLSLTGDNAVMIALAGTYRFEAGHKADPLTLTANANMHLA